MALGVILAWVVAWYFLKGHDTLALPGREHTPLHNAFAKFRDDMLAGRETNPVMLVSNEVSLWFRTLIEWLQGLISVPAFPRPVPQIGWLGVVALATWTAYAIANWRIAILVACSFLSFGAFGYWSDSMDLLIVTFMAVGLTVLIGMPIAVLIGVSPRADRVIATILDLMQTMPTFVYLIPVVLFFGIGASGAVVCSLVYALPPIIRIAGYGISSVSPTTLEATDSTGQSGWQRLVKVQVPMARRTIIVGLNQTTMAALSMATIASYINGPGLGKPVLDGLIKGDFGGSFVPGVLIVVMAVMLDRTTTAASERREKEIRAGHFNPRRRGLLLGALAVPTLIAVWLSRFYPWAATFPATRWGAATAQGAEDVMTTVVRAIGDATGAFKDAFSLWLLNPMQSVLSESPWYVTGTAIVALATVLGGWRALLAAVICLVGIYGLGLWQDAMVTLNMTLLATAMVMVLALVFGVWMARSRLAELIIRPILDAGQTIPPFVYLIPVLALFDTTRFSAIIAGIIYAAPAAIKLVADGIKQVNPGTLEAGRSTGSTVWQEITKVQLPMAKGSLVLATNQGLLYVLAMAVIGGMVGAGALGYTVVLGVSRSEEWGKGLAAGLTIVLLGIMLDRIARAAARDD